MNIAITGGIGSGKSFVCRLLEERGIKVYDCDKAAKRLMLISGTLQESLSALVGQDIFPDGVMNKDLLRQFITLSEENAQAVDDIVHPAVGEDFIQSGCEWLESAILFESRFNKRITFDYIICVTAPEETRIERIIHRDNISRSKAQAWINAQMPQEEKARQSDFVIVNDGETDVNQQLDKLLKLVNKK